MNPSSANRRVACPGSYSLESLYPMIQESPSIKEGKAAHWVANNILKGNHKMGSITPNGEQITKEMLEGAQLYYDSVTMPGLPLHRINIEKHLDISIIHPDCKGTPDSWAIDENENHLYIWDYKYGHTYVEVFQNWQLLEYAAGIYAQSMPLLKITMTIVQPRCFSSNSPVRSWTITIKQLQEYIILLQKAEALATSFDPPQSPSSQCSHCAGRHACQTLQQSGFQAVDLSLDNTPWELSPLSTANELRYLKRASELLDARITGLSEQARSMIVRGEIVPGFTLESTSSREHWTKPAEEIILLGQLLGLDLSKPPEAVTPNQARKLGVDEILVSEYAQRSQGALKLIEIKNNKKVFNS